MVFIHAPHPGQFGIFLDVIARWAVPFFFVVSGYLAAGTTRSPIAETKRVISRIGKPYLFWVCFYFIVLPKSPDPLSVKDILRVFLLGGPAIHLWFLPALGISLILFRCIQQYSAKNIIVIAILLYIFGLFVGAYAPSDLKLPFNPRNGPFLSVPMVLAGALYRRVQSMTLSRACASLFVCFILYFMEVYFFRPRQLDQVIMTSAIGFLPLPIALALNGPFSKAFSFLGQYAFGFYLVHLLIVFEIERFFYPTDSMTLMAFILLVSMLALLITFMLWQFKLTRQLVE